MNLQESGEMYLETILILLRSSSSVRAIDVGEYMGYSKPSVSRAMGKLKSDGFIALTETGRTVAEKIYERHTLLTDFIEGMGVSRETAAADACKIEHDISDETFEAIKRFVNKK